MLHPLAHLADVLGLALCTVLLDQPKRDLKRRIRPGAGGLRTVEMITTGARAQELAICNDLRIMGRGSRPINPR
jgi:hypothetical protein